MLLGFVRLWPGGENSDPWNAPAAPNPRPPGGQVADYSLPALVEFRTHWNANMQAIPRTLAHMLSSKDLGGGVADMFEKNTVDYLAVVCDYWRDPGNNRGYGEAWTR